MNWCFEFLWLVHEHLVLEVFQELRSFGIVEVFLPCHTAPKTQSPSFNVFAISRFKNWVACPLGYSLVRNKWNAATQRLQETCFPLLCCLLEFEPCRAEVGKNKKFGFFRFDFARVVCSEPGTSSNRVQCSIRPQISALLIRPERKRFLDRKIFAIKVTLSYFLYSCVCVSHALRRCRLKTQDQQTWW